MGFIERIKPTDWDEAKTDTIDFTRPFLWFDDDLYPEEWAVLEAHNALDRWVGIDLTKDPNQLYKALGQLRRIK